MRLDRLHVQRVGVGSPGGVERRRAGRLHAHQARQALYPTQGQHILETLVQPADDAAVAHAHKDTVGHLPVQLLADFKSGGLFTLGHVGVVARVAVVPAVFLAGLQAQLKSLVVGPVHGQHLRAIHQQLGNLGLGSGGRHENDVFYAQAGR